MYYYTNWVQKEFGDKDYWCLVTETAVYGDQTLNEKANILNWAPVGYEYLIEDSYKDYIETSMYRKPDALFNVVINSVAENKSELNDKWKELYVKCVMTTEDKFDEVYQAACKEYLELGYQESWMKNKQQLIRITIDNSQLYSQGIR